MSKKLLLSLSFCLFHFFLLAQRDFAIITNPSWLFLNIENRLWLTLHDIPHDEIKILSNLGHKLSVGSDGSFKLTTKSKVALELKVYRYTNQDSTLLYKRKFSVKPMPNPTASLDGKFRSEMLKNEFLSKRGIIAEVLNYDYDLRVPVEKYTILVLQGKKLLYLEDCEGAFIKNNTKKELIKILKGGERIILTNIEIKPHYHFNKYVNSIQIKIKN